MQSRKHFPVGTFVRHHPSFLKVNAQVSNEVYLVVSHCLNARDEVVISTLFDGLFEALQYVSSAHTIGSFVDRFGTVRRRYESKTKDFKKVRLHAVRVSNLYIVDNASSNEDLLELLPLYEDSP